MSLVVLDGPVGTELAARGVPTPAPAWSAAALESAPDVVEQIHRDYATAGAVVHTAATFRTTQRAVGARWQELTLRAVALARRGAGLPLTTNVASAASSPRVAGSIAPLEDCYRPDLSPADPRPEHRALARALAAAGVDMLLCETFPHVGEALIAVEEAVATGLPTWLALTAGPDGSLMSVAELAEGAREATLRGAQAVLVNCVPAIRTLDYVERLASIGPLRCVRERGRTRAWSRLGRLARRRGGRLREARGAVDRRRRDAGRQLLRHRTGAHRGARGAIAPPLRSEVVRFDNFPRSDRQER